MTMVEIINRNERHMLAVGKFKPQFSWCIRCAGFDGCYPEGHGPCFLDQDCYRGPMTEKEMEAAKTDEFD